MVFDCLNFALFQIGPGLVHLHFTSVLGPGIFVQTLTPLEPLHQVMTHKLFATWKVPLWLGRLFLLAEAIQVSSFKSKIKSNLYYTRRITPKRVTSCGAHLRSLAPGLHSSEETSQRWRVVGDTVPI